MDVSTVTAKWVEVPHEPGNRLQFRMLSGAEMEEASDHHLTEYLTKFHLEVDQIPAMQKSMEGVERDDAKAEQTAASGLSTAYLLQHGLMGWEGPLYGPWAADGSQRLDARTRDWAADQVADLSFISEGEGNGSGPGTE